MFKWQPGSTDYRAALSVVYKVYIESTYKLRKLALVIAWPGIDLHSYFTRYLFIHLTTTTSLWNDILLFNLSKLPLAKKYFAYNFGDSKFPPSLLSPKVLSKQILLLLWSYTIPRWRIKLNQGTKRSSAKT